MMSPQHLLPTTLVDSLSARGGRPGLYGSTRQEEREGASDWQETEWRECGNALAKSCHDNASSSTSSDETVTHQEGANMCPGESLKDRKLSENSEDSFKDRELRELSQVQRARAFRKVGAWLASLPPSRSESGTMASASLPMPSPSASPSESDTMASIRRQLRAEKRESARRLSIEGSDQNGAKLLAEAVAQSCRKRREARQRSGINVSWSVADLQMLREISEETCTA